MLDSSGIVSTRNVPPPHRLSGQLASDARRIVYLPNTRGTNLPVLAM